MKVYKSIEELIGHTPLLELAKLKRMAGLYANIYAKLEKFNPAGSSKDRTAKWMLDDAEEKGLIKPGATIIEPTSGNTGIGLAMIAAARGYKLKIVMPDSMSQERIRLMQAYGAQVILTPGEEGMAGAIAKAEALADEIPGSFIPGQFDNPANVRAHFESTGPEIYEDLDGKVDYFIAGIGTGGTITGVAKYLKSKNKDVQIIGVEPLSSPLLSGGKSGPHGLQGIGANFIPSILDQEIYDEIIPVPDGGAYICGQLVAATEGVLVGITSGAVLWAAMLIAKRLETTGKNIVLLMPDTGERYLSSEMFTPNEDDEDDEDAEEEWYNEEEE